MHKLNLVNDNSSLRKSWIFVVGLLTVLLLTLFPFMTSIATQKPMATKTKTNPRKAHSKQRNMQRQTYIQLAAYYDPKRATMYAQAMKHEGLKPLTIHTTQFNQKKLYQVQLGPYANAKATQQILQRLKQKKINYFIRSRHRSQHLKPAKSKSLKPSPIAKLPKPPRLFSAPTPSSPKKTTARVDKKTTAQAHLVKQERIRSHTAFAENHHQQFIHDTLPNLKKLNHQRSSKPIQNHAKQRSLLKPQQPSTPKKTSTLVEHKRLWNLRNVDIRSVIEEVSRETGKNFIVDPRVEGQISIISSTPIDDTAVYQMFLSALNVLGYSAVPTGNIIKIVPSIEAKQLNTPIVTPYRHGQGDEPVVRVIAVKNVSSEQLVPLLRPLLPEWGSVVAYAPSNILIIAGTAANVSRISQIIQRVDTTNTDGIAVIPLHYAMATDLVKTIKALRSRDQNNIDSQVTLAAESQSNTILVSGPKASRLKMRVLISELDTPSASGSDGDTQVIYLHFMKARDIVPILAGVAKSYGNAVGTVIGTITGQKGYTRSASIVGDSGSGNGVNLPGPSAQMNGSNQKAIETQTSGEAGKPKVEIIGDPNTNSIIINAPPTVMRTLKVVISQLDIRPAQVLVEALIAEVDETRAFQLGIKWGTLASPNESGVINTQDFSTTAASIMTAIFQQGIGIINGKGIHNLAGVIQALENDQNADILSTPSVIVLDNHQAKIEVGQRISISDSTYPNNANGTAPSGSPFTTFKRENVALHLYVTPSISRNSTVQLAIDQGNDSLQNPNDPTTTPIVNISSIRTSVLVRSGNILVLGGLIQNEINHGESKVPFLGNIPIVGHLFNVASQGHDRKMLMVFIRPIIIRSHGTGLLITHGKYHYIREQQLNWVGHQHYYEGLNEGVLPPWGGQAKLPKPFA